MSREPMAPEKIEEALSEMSGWSYERDSIHKTFEFPDFRTAMGFILQVSYAAEELDHHPELHNVYNRVDVSLSTHDAGDRVTEMDLKLARAADQVARTR